MTIHWTEPMDADLLRLWTTMALSASKCAAELALMYGDLFTRNSVIGRIYRLGIGRPNNNPARPPQKNRKTRVRKPQTERSVVNGQYTRTAVVQRSEPNPINIPFHLLKSGQCKYIKGEVCGHDVIACGAPANDLQSYCPAHCHICYRPEDTRQRRLSRSRVAA